METHLQRNDTLTRAQRFDVEVPADIWIPNQDEYITPPTRRNTLLGKFLPGPRKGFKYSLKAFIEKVVTAMGISSTGYTFGNGITETSGAVKLGGTLTENTTIDASGLQSLTLEPNSLAVTTYGNIALNNTNTSGGITLQSSGSGSFQVLGPGESLSLVTFTGAANLSGATTTIGTVSPSGGNTSILSNDGVIITAQGTLGTNQDVTIEATNGNIILSLTSIPTYADDAAAGVGGLTAGMLYKTATGGLQIKL